MKKYLIVLVLGSAAVYSLEPGKHYDFFQKNGQNVLGAELLQENEDEYVVRLKYVPKPIKLSKSDLTGEPELSKTQPASATKPIIRRDFTLHASAGFSYLTFGAIGKIFTSGYEARVGSDWRPFETPFHGLRAISVVASFANYQSAPRRIQLVSVQAGPKFLLWHFKSLDATLFASPLVGMSFADLRGYTFTSSYTTLSATGLIGFEKRWKNLGFAAQLYANSLFDSSLNFASSGISIAATYPIGAAQPL